MAHLYVSAFGAVCPSVELNGAGQRAAGNGALPDHVELNPVMFARTHRFGFPDCEVADRARTQELMTSNFKGAFTIYPTSFVNRPSTLSH